MFICRYSFLRSCLLLTMLFLTHTAGAQSSDDYVIVGNHADLRVGDTLVIVSTSCTHALGVKQNTNNRAATPITLVNNRLTSNADVQQVILEPIDRFWLLRVGDGKYLHAAGGSSNNYLRTTDLAEARNSGICNIKISGGNAVIEFQRTQNSETTKYLSFNPGSAFNAPLFACYDGENTVYLFRKDRYTSTNITTIHTTQQHDGCVYDLMGRAYAEGTPLPKGVYIRRGKCFIVR